MKKILSIFIILYFLISCGSSITPPENDNESGKVIVIDTNKTYTVRMGSIVTNIKPSDMTNAWISYIGGKKVLKPDGKTDAGWRFKEGTGDYWEDSYSTTSQRATLVGAVIKQATDGNTYLMGMYYNHKMVFQSGGSQFMLIYITEAGTEKGYYGGGREQKPLPDSSTEWFPYDKFFPQGLGKLIDY